MHKREFSSGQFVSLGPQSFLKDAKKYDQFLINKNSAEFGSYMAEKALSQYQKPQNVKSKKAR